MKGSNVRPLLFGKTCTIAIIAIMCTTFLPSNQIFAESVSTPLELMIGTKKVTLNFKNRPIKTVLEAIKGQTGIGYAISAEAENAIGKVSIEVKDATIADALDIIFANTNEYSYVAINNQIVITKKTPQKGEITVWGTVIDNHKEPVPGAIVLVKGGSTAVETDLDGNFAITLNKPETIEVSFVGYKPYTQYIDRNQKNLLISLETDNILDEVVVTGIFNKSRETYTGSVTTITDKELVNFKGQNLVATLKNIDPVMNISINNSLGSDPNALPDLSIRGNASLGTSLEEVEQGANAQLNTPLIIMDGFEISLQKLMDYNDEDIESMNILKDASATAIYGSRGANGVIVVTTKAPEAGKIKVYFKGGINLELPDLTSYDLMNAKEKLQLEYDNGIYNDDKSVDDDIKLKELYYTNVGNIYRGVNTDWISQPVRLGVGQKYNLNLTGGNNQFRWRASLGYNDIAGAMKGSDRSNFSGSLNLAYSHNNLIFKNQTTITTTKATQSKYGNFSDYATMNPYWPIYDDNGNMIKSYTLPKSGATPSTVGNPLFNSTLNTYNISKYTEIVNNFSIEWDILEGLRLRGQLGIAKTFNTTDAFFPAEHTKFQDYAIEEAMNRGEYNYSTGEAFALTGNATISYSKTFADKHSVYVGADAAVSNENSFLYNFSAIGFPNEDLDFIGSSLGYADGSKPWSTESTSRAVGFTLNANYSYDNKYFIDGSFRSDGSSLFGGNNRFAPFWSAGLGWNIHREEFMKNQNVVSNLKLRASMGESGSQNFSAYQALSTYQYYTDTRYGIWNGAYLLSHGNPNLKWQKVFQYNVGLDVSFLDGRISAAVDVYKKNTRDLLSRRDLQASTGFTSYTENIGEISNHGIEGMLSGYIIRDLEKELIWSVSAKIAYNKNRIEKLSEALKKDTQKAMQEDVEMNSLLFEGDPTNAIYAVRSLGIDPSTGEELFMDKNGNISRTWRAGDKVFMGTSDPLYRGNFSSLLQWRGLSLNLAFGYYWGGYQYNTTLLNKVEVTRNIIAEGNVDRRVYADRWQKPGDVKFYKKIDDVATRATSRFVMKDNTFELQNVSLQYTFDSQALKERAKIQSIILGANMSDVFHISTIKRERGTNYPFARHAEVSVSLTF